MRGLLVLCCWCQTSLAGSIAVISLEQQSATVGSSATLQCHLMTTHPNVFQITWQKESGNFTGPVATYSKKYGQKLIGYSSNRMEQRTADTLNASAITISPVTLEDQGCYSCIFNVYPFGANSGRTCLSVCEASISEPQLQINTIALPGSSEKLLVVTCAASGQPAPNISWNLPGSLQLKPHTYNICNSDQTVTVISNFTQRVSRTFHTPEGTCTVRHPALGSEIHLNKLIQYTGEDTSAERGASRHRVLVPFSLCVIVALLALMRHRIQRAQERVCVFWGAKPTINTQRTLSMPNSEITCNNTGYTPCLPL